MPAIWAEMACRRGALLVARALLQRQDVPWRTAASLQAVLGGEALLLSGQPSGGAAAPAAAAGWQRRRSSAAAAAPSGAGAPAPCWQCGASRTPGDQFFCPACGSIQPAAPDAHYFALFGL